MKPNLTQIGMGKEISVSISIYLTGSGVQTIAVKQNIWESLNNSNFPQTKLSEYSVRVTWTTFIVLLWSMKVAIQSIFIGRDGLWHAWLAFTWHKSIWTDSFFLCRTSCCSVGRTNRKSGPASPSSWNYSRNCRNATVACLTQYTSGNQLSMWNELNSKMPVYKKNKRTKKKKKPTKQTIMR